MTSRSLFLKDGLLRDGSWGGGSGSATAAASAVGPVSSVEEVVGRVEAGKSEAPENGRDIRFR